MMRMFGRCANGDTGGCARADRQKPSGIAHKEGVLRVHVIPFLGPKKLDAIRNEDVQRLTARLHDRSPKTVNNLLTVLNTMLKKAVEWAVLDRTPCVLRLLKVSQAKFDFYDFAEFETFLAAATALSPQAHLIALLSGEVRLRTGEMRALVWTAIDFGRRQICFSKSVWRGQVGLPKGNRIRHVPLTPTGDRGVPGIPAPARAVGAVSQGREPDAGVHPAGPPVACRSDRHIRGTAGRTCCGTRSALI